MLSVLKNHDGNRAADPVTFVGVCRSAADRRVLATARKSFETVRSSRSNSLARPHVYSLSDLQAGIAAVRRQPDNLILLTVGYEESQVADALAGADAEGLEVLICPKWARSRNGRTPTASLLDRSPNIVGVDLATALRKAHLRLQVARQITIRRLETAADFDAYFALRYRVWKQMRYIPQRKECSISKWELDYTDRTALPIGAFARGGEMVGCGRLVQSFGNEIPREELNMLEELVLRRRDPQLLENFKYPPDIRHPYDLLEGFPKFSRYFMRLIRSRVSHAEVSRIIVASDYRRHGIGEVIVDSLVSLARLQRISVLFLACVEKHRTYYERCGFRMLKGLRCQRFVDVDVPAIAMTRRVSPRH